MTVVGDNFVSSTGWQCQFGNSTPISASRTSNNNIVCSASPANAYSPLVPFYLLLNGNFVYDAISPNGTAGTTQFGYIPNCNCQNNGVCGAAGTCICAVGWMGQNCTDPQVALSFQSLAATYNVTEFINVQVIGPVPFKSIGVKLNEVNSVTL